jgi:hypothetical protein
MNKKLFAGLVVLGALAIPLAGLASAGTPAQPGCFGQDRAAALHQMQDNTYANLPAAPGASEWGQIAGQRAGDNGTINQNYICLP